MREYAQKLELYGREKLSSVLERQNILADIDPHIFVFQESYVGKFFARSSLQHLILRWKVY